MEHNHKENWVDNGDGYVIETVIGCPACIELVGNGILEGKLESFETVLQLQEQMMREVYVMLKTKSREEILIAYADGLLAEAFEVKMELPWKHWKKPKDVDLEKVKEEVVDCLIFTMGLIIASGMTHDEVLEKTVSKMQVNVERQLSHY